MKPTLTGIGYGSKFINAIVEQGRSLLNFKYRSVRKQPL